MLSQWVPWLLLEEVDLFVSTERCRWRMRSPSYKSTRLSGITDFHLRVTFSLWFEEKFLVQVAVRESSILWSRSSDLWTREKKNQSNVFIMKINSPYDKLNGGQGRRQNEKGPVLNLWILVVDNSFIQSPRWHSPITAFMHSGTCPLRVQTTEFSLTAQNSEADQVSFQEPPKPNCRYMGTSPLLRHHRLQSSHGFLVFSTAASILDELNSPLWELTAAGKHRAS